MKVVSKIEHERLPNNEHMKSTQSEICRELIEIFDGSKGTKEPKEEYMYSETEYHLRHIEQSEGIELALTSKVAFLLYVPLVLACKFEI